MPPQTVLFLGPAGSGKTHEMVRLYREALRRAGPTGVFDRALWLAPTSRNATLIREQLLADGLDACLAPRIVTFDELTDLILATGATAPAVGLTAAMQRELLRRIIAHSLDADQLTHFADAAGRNGFVDLLAEHIRELQRHGVSPAAYAKSSLRRDRSAEHRELAMLYAEYERQLQSNQLADNESRHAAARDALAANNCPQLQNLELVVVDGFTDFTHPQHELLKLLASRSQQLLIALPSDSIAGSTCATGSASALQFPCDRPDLFAKVQATIAELRHFHPKLEVRHVAPRPLAWPALDHLAQHIFRNPRQVPPLPAAAVPTLDRLEIVAAASTHDEIVQLARRIKKRLADGEARPGDLVVAFRSLKDAAPRIREVFSEFGIPYALETGLPLATAAVLRTLLSLLRLTDEDWPFRRVVAVLTNNALTAIPDDARRATDWLVRDLQVAQGRDALLQRVEQLAETDLATATLSEHAECRAVAAKAALPAFRLLAATLSELPDNAPPLDWRAALSQLGIQLGLAPFSEQPSEGRTRHFSDQLMTNNQFPVLTPDAAWRNIEQHFTALERLDASLTESPRPLSRRKLLDWLLDLTQHESLSRTHDDVGRVRILSAATARTITARHLYLAGMSEQAFPSPERAGGLSNSEEYQFFSRAADQEFAKNVTSVPLALPVLGRPQEEMLLFYEVMTRACESLTISYPALDDKAQQLPPSPYVTELLRTLGRENELLVRRVTPQLSPIPPADAPPMSPTDWRLQAIAQAVGDERDKSLLAGIFRADGAKPLAAALEAGLRITHARQRRDEFGPAEGLLTSPAVAARLAERFGPKHLWSPSQWEKYAACPYKFYQEEVLGLEPLGDLVLETDHRRRGSLLHDVLASFHRKYGDAAADWSALQRDEARFVDELRQTLQAAIDARPRDGIDAALQELDRRQIDKWIDLYRDQHAKYDAAWTKLDLAVEPTYFELRFGPKRRGSDELEDPHSVNAAFQLDIGSEKILVTGRIDRIDVGHVGDNAVFNVIDYKSGQRPSLSQEKIEAGERLQPALYVMAAEALVFGPDKAAPLWAGYWSMKSGVTTDKRYSLQCSTDGATPAEDWTKMRPKIIQRIAQFVTAIRRGEFPVASRDPDCTSRCEFHTTCRISQIRSLGKIPEPETETSTSTST
jgi:ATP-dependent helicase/DNAse subunit B